MSKGKHQSKKASPTPKSNVINLEDAKQIASSRKTSKLKNNKQRKNSSDGSPSIPTSPAQEPKGKDKGVKELSGFPKLIKNLELFRDQQNQPCAVRKGDPNREVFYVGTKPFKQLLEGLFYDEYEGIPTRPTLTDGIRLAEFKSIRGKSMKTVWKRFAFVDDTIYIDMNDGNGSVIVVNKDGYSIKPITEANIYFHRSPISAPLPTPISGGDYMSMFKSMNLKNQNDRCLVATWPIVAVIPGIPKPPLMIYGPAGSTKSTMALMIKNIIAPDAKEGLKIKNNEAEMAQIIDKHAIPFFDNVTPISQNIADLLCMAVTGGSFSKRKLYTDSDDVVFNLQKPIITTSLGIWTSASDLLDRCIFVELNPIDVSSRKDRTSILDEYEAKRGQYLGAFLDALSLTLKHLNDQPPLELPRMADYYKWAYAASQALGFDPNDFIEAYHQSCLKGQLNSLDEDDLGRLLIEFIETTGAQETPSTSFHKRFLDFAEKKGVGGANLPKSAAVLSKTLSRLQYAFQPFGLTITIKRTKDANVICVAKVEQASRGN